MHTLEIYQLVVLTQALSEPSVKEGTLGVVVEMLPSDGVAVEFFDSGGKTVDVALIPEAYVRAATKTEQKAARQAAAKADSKAIEGMIQHDRS